MRGLSISGPPTKLYKGWVECWLVNMRFGSLSLRIDQCFGLRGGCLKSWLFEVSWEAEAVGLRFGETAKDSRLKYMHCVCR